MKHCNQCGKPYNARACGHVHAAIGAGNHSVRDLLGPIGYGQLRRVDPDEESILKTACWMAAGRRAKLVLTLKEGLLIDVSVEDGGPV